MALLGRNMYRACKQDTLLQYITVVFDSVLSHWHVGFCCNINK
jgi:hypothetical protein